MWWFPWEIFRLVASISIFSRDPNLSRKPPRNLGKRIRFLRRTMVEKNGESTQRIWVGYPSLAKEMPVKPWCVVVPLGTHISFLLELRVGSSF